MAGVVGPRRQLIHEQPPIASQEHFDAQHAHDLEGFQDTLANGTLGFDSDRDFFAGKNVTAIVIELETADIDAGSDNTFSVWASTARIGS